MSANFRQFEDDLLFDVRLTRGLAELQMSYSRQADDVKVLLMP